MNCLNGADGMPCLSFGKGVPVLEFYTFCHHSSPITLYPFIGKGYRVIGDESVDKFLVIT